MVFQNESHLMTMGTDYFVLKLDFGTFVDKFKCLKVAEF